MADTLTAFKLYGLLISILHFRCGMNIHPSWQAPWDQQKSVILGLLLEAWVIPGITLVITAAQQLTYRSKGHR